MIVVKVLKRVLIEMVV